MIRINDSIKDVLEWKKETDFIFELIGKDTQFAGEYRLEFHKLIKSIFGNMSILKIRKVIEISKKDLPQENLNKDNQEMFNRLKNRINYVVINEIA